MAKITHHSGIYSMRVTPQQLAARLDCISHIPAVETATLEISALLSWVCLKCGTHNTTRVQWQREFPDGRCGKCHSPALLSYDRNADLPPLGLALDWVVNGAKALPALVALVPAALGRRIDPFYPQGNLKTLAASRKRRRAKLEPCPKEPDPRARRLF